MVEKGQKVSKITGSYYPFGLKHKGYNNVISSNGNSVAQRKKFGGFEFQDELGLNWYDITARNYDPSIGRWMNIDPAADVLESSSQYVYALNSPIVYVDKDGELPILINGNTFDDGQRGDASYWAAEIIATIKGSGIANPGGNIHYVDGNRGVVGEGKNERVVETWLMGPANNAKKRDRAGYLSAKADFQNIIAQLERDPETGKITEKIQIYTHSRGAAFGAGYTRALLELIKKNSNLFADPNNVIDLIINLAPNQSKKVKSPSKNSVSMRHDGDPFSGNGMKGTSGVFESEVDGGPITVHGNGSFVTELSAFIEAFLSNDSKVTQETIDDFIKKAKEQGIDVKVQQ